MSKSPDHARGEFQQLPLPNKFNVVLSHNRRLLNDNIQLGDKIKEQQHRIDFLEGRRTELMIGMETLRNMVANLEQYREKANLLLRDNDRQKRRIKYLETLIERSSQASTIELLEMEVHDQGKKIKDLQRVIAALK